MLQLRSRGLIRSWLGWPVPPDMRIVSAQELAVLVEVATRLGFSRKAKDLEPREGVVYGLLAYHPENSPEPSWMCLVVAIEGEIAQEKIKPIIMFGRLDVRLSDFSALRRARRAERDQLLHWFAWKAYEARGSQLSPSEE